MAKIPASELPFSERQAIESYLEERTAGVVFPANLACLATTRFHVVGIQKVPHLLNAPAKLRPCSGGFFLYIRSPGAREPDLRFLLAHELAHTFFYEQPALRSVPRHCPHPHEEALCDFGARALLLPRHSLPCEITRLAKLRDILHWADRLQVRPRWLVERMAMDLGADDLAFFVYRSEEGKLRKREGISTYGEALEHRFVAWIHRELPAFPDHGHGAVPVATGANSVLSEFTVEVFRDVVDMFRQDMYVLVRHKSATST